jgi:hypothetical protein
MRGEHTPGPWTDDEAGFLGFDGRPVGQPERGKALLDEMARVEADRRLMRLAPSMLLALRLHDALPAWPDSEALAAAMEVTRAVLAQAEGRSDA